MWPGRLLRALGVLGCAVQYGCVAHCTLEYVGELVVSQHDRSDKRPSSGALSAVLLLHLSRLTKCSGPSMQPSLYTNDVVLAEHFSRHLGRIRRGDVVIARNPANPRTFICKRVVALPGDALNKRLPHHSSRYVPLGHVWLEGDNAANSTDSRSYGPVPYALIRGRVCLKVPSSSLKWECRRR
ncbi:mitochondrial inner membrane protease subunit 1-like [Petromyzon marinus]|uniref:mitochondrial inner membrane protease subunit 1-like n=1 Tax=Petromyzon marinus TaxID=7757 RepID=UPI003F6EE2EF